MLWLNLNKLKYIPLYSTKGPSHISVSASDTSKGATPTLAGRIIKNAIAAGNKAKENIKFPSIACAFSISSME